jgi:peptide/nickel transport system permease protein
MTRLWRFIGSLPGGARLGLVMLIAYVTLGIVGPWIAPFDVDIHSAGLVRGFAPPSDTHWLGTDSNGVDALSQLFWGAREALKISLGVVLASALIGLVLGTTAGYFGGWVDELIMRVVDILMAFPGILLNIAIVATVKRPGVGLVMAALIANGWVGYARVARGQVLSLRERDFVAAARAIGATNTWIMTRHIAPNLLGPLTVQMAFGLGTVISIEAALSFLGLGPHIDYTWGAMLEQGRTFLYHPGFLHYALAPGLAIMWVVLAANLAGDGLRDRLDPRNRGR